MTGRFLLRGDSLQVKIGAAMGKTRGFFPFDFAQGRNDSYFPATVVRCGRSETQIPFGNDNKFDDNKFNDNESDDTRSDDIRMTV